MSLNRRLAILALWDLAVASYTQPTPDPEAPAEDLLTIDIALQSVGLNFHAVAFGGQL